MQPGASGAQSPGAGAQARPTGARAPGLPGFVARAETERRTGRPEEALRILQTGLAQGEAATSEGRVALALALWDLGRAEEARWELEVAVTPEASSPAPSGFDASPPAGPETFDEAELDRAFEEAHPDLEQTVDADRIALEAMREAHLERPEGLIAHPSSPFATRTVAELLESQGDRRGAEAVRSVLGERTRSGPAPSAAATASPLAARRAQVIETLERWLENLRRGWS